VPRELTSLLILVTLAGCAAAEQQPDPDAGVIPEVKTTPCDGYFDGGVMFGTAVGVPSGDQMTAIAVADFDGDGKDDLAFGNGSATAAGVEVSRSLGSGVFLPPIDYLNGPTACLVAGDFNGDGKPDLAACSAGPAIRLLLNQGDGTFAPGSTIQLAGPGTFAVTGDFNGDGALDLAVFEAGFVEFLIQSGGGWLLAPVAQGGMGNAIVAGHFTGSAATDLAVVQPNDQDLLIISHLDLSGTMQSTQVFPAPSMPVSVSGAVAGDFNGDGLADLMIVGASRTLLLADGHGSFGIASSEDAPVFSGQQVVLTRPTEGDFDGDGHLDFAATWAVSCAGSSCASRTEVDVWLNDGTGKLCGPLPVWYREDASAPLVALSAIDRSPHSGLIFSAGTNLLLPNIR